MSNGKVTMVKGDDRREVFWSIDKRQLEKEGYVIEGQEAPKPEPKKLPEVEVGEDPFEKAEEDHEPLEFMTKAELLDYAMERGVDLKNALPKAEILEACKAL